MKYFEIEGAPGRYFNCPNGFGTMSMEFCAGSHRLANQPKNIEIGRRFACRHCPVGIYHAGGDAPTQSQIYGRPVCIRCGRGANRLILERYCRSCHNRIMELRRGRNAKGQPLCRTRPLVTIDILVARDGAATLQKITEVQSPVEALHVLLKNKPGGYFSVARRPAVLSN